MKRMITTVALAAAMLLAASPAAFGGEPTCFNQFGSGWANHGEHILGYVDSGEIVGGGPAHFGNEDEFGPGASFCLDQARAGVVRP